MIIYRFKIICTVCHTLQTVNIKTLLLHALRRTVVIKYTYLYIHVHTYIIRTFARTHVCSYVRMHTYPPNVCF